MNIGDVVTTASFRAEFGTKGDGGYASYKAPKGERFVFLLLGSSPVDGSRPVDCDAVLNALGWRFGADDSEDNGTEEPLAESPKSDTDASRFDGRPCTCHPDDNPPVPCAGKFALSECMKAADGASSRHEGKLRDEQNPLPEQGELSREAVEAVIADLREEKDKWAGTGAYAPMNNAANRLDAILALPSPGGGEEFLEFKETLSDLRSLRHEYDCLNGGGPGWSERNKAAWKRADDLFADEDEAAYQRQQEDAHG